MPRVLSVAVPLYRLLWERDLGGWILVEDDDPASMETGTTTAPHQKRNGLGSVGGSDGFPSSFYFSAACRRLFTRVSREF